MKLNKLSNLLILPFRPKHKNLSSPIIVNLILIKKYNTNNIHSIKPSPKELCIISPEDQLY